MSTRAMAVAVAILAAGVVAPAARADKYGPYDPKSGQYYADEQRAQQRLGYDAYGTGRTRDWRPFYSGAYYAPPAYSLMPPANYSYGAYAPSAPDNAAHLRVIVPAGAKVWFGNAATQQTGGVRFFESPALTPGKDYTYDIKATWTENGKEVTRTRHVGVRANSNETVDFTRPESGK